MSVRTYLAHSSFVFPSSSSVPTSDTHCGRSWGLSLTNKRTESGCEDGQDVDDIGSYNHGPRVDPSYDTSPERFETTQSLRGP